MFYSHEILTSRKYGVATVWLVATLGAKSGQKRITRKQILDVDVTKACRTITDPVAPMALRLQGNLLLGVSRVYLQQANYVLSDAQSAQNTMVVLLRSVHNTELDLGAGKARPEQLVLPDDPSFLPDFALPAPDVLADLNLNFDFDIARLGDSQSLTPFGSQGYGSSQPIGGLVFPSSSPHAPAEFRLPGDDGLDNRQDNFHEPGFIPGGDDGLDLSEPGFTFGEDGDLIDLPVRSSVARTPGAPPGSVMRTDAGASTQVRQDHGEGQEANTQIPVDDMDIDLPIIGVDLPEGEAFSLAGQQQGSEHSEQVQSTSTTSAPLRQRRRTPRTIPKDFKLEITNKELADWKTGYLDNMKTAAQRKINGHAVQQAKKNATHYVWGSGLGAIGTQLSGPMESHPFNMFMGDSFFELVTGVSRQKTGVKRKKSDRDSGIDDATQNDARSVRQKTGELEGNMGRGIEDEGFPMLGEDDAEVELPREPAIALDDQQLFSAMPWNISASKRGSSVVPRSGLSGREGSFDLQRRGSRMVSASPLLGRGQPMDLDPLQLLESDGDFAFGGDDFALPELSSDYPEPQHIAQASVRVRDALSAEGENFLAFVADAISEKRSRVQADLDPMTEAVEAEAADDAGQTTFEELLPPHANTKVVACQGLMMVLGLGTKGMLDVQQPDHFGEINMKLTVMGRAAHMVHIAAGREQEAEEEEEHQSLADGGHSEEQFPADYAPREDDDHGSLYDN